MKRNFLLDDILKSSFVINVFINCCIVQDAVGRITFGVVRDDAGYASQTVDVINYIMPFVKSDSEKLQYTIKYIDPSVPLTKQLEGICYSEEDFDVLFSATCCGLLHDLAKESSSNGILHFAVNIDHCISRNNAVLLDTMPMQDVAQAIADVVSDRNKKADIVVLHDTEYERPSTVKSLLRELNSRGIRYSYLLFDVNVTKVSRRLDMVRKGATQLSTVVLADFSEFKSLVDKMYDSIVLDSGVSYLIINDGWEYENPEIEAPQPINYTIDLHLLLLKRKISEDFSNFLKDILTRSGDEVVDRFVKWKVPYIVRGDLFVAAAVWSVAEAYKLVQTSKKLKMQNKCPSFNETIGPVGSNEFVKLSMKFMREIGVLSDSLQYDLFRNIPVDSKTEIFRRIAHWKVPENPRLQYLSPNIESKLLFENRTLKLGMPFNPPYTFRADEDDEEIEKGAVIKLFDYLTKRLKFKYEVLEPEDNEWGVLMDDGKWSGTISMLLDRTVDLVPFLGITQGRNKDVQFSEPVMTTCSAILIQKPREPPRTLIFLKPFTGHVWFLIGFMIPIMSFVLYLVNNKSWYFMHKEQKKMKGGLFKFRNCFWYMYGAILQQGGVHLPETISARIIVCFWWLFVMVTVATYSGNLIAFLTFPEADWKVTSVQDLARKQSLTVTVMEGTSIHQEIEESPMETLQILKTRFLYHQNALLISNISSVLDDIEEGKVAYIDDFYVLSELIKIQHNKTGKCKLALAPKTFQEIYLAIASRKGSPYMKDINTYIRHLWHGGLMQRWAEQYAQLKSHECYFVPTTLRGGRKDVTLNDLLGAFIMLVSGLGISLFIILFEIIWTRLKKQCSPQMKKTFTNRNCIYYISTIILKKILASKI